MSSFIIALSFNQKHPYIHPLTNTETNSLAKKAKVFVNERSTRTPCASVFVWGGCGWWELGFASCILRSIVNGDGGCRQQPLEMAKNVEPIKSV